MTYDQEQLNKLKKALEIAQRVGNTFMEANILKAIQALTNTTSYDE